MNSPSNARCSRCGASRPSVQTTCPRCFHREQEAPARTSPLSAPTENEAGSSATPDYGAWVRNARSRPFASRPIGDPEQETLFHPAPTALFLFLSVLCLLTAFYVRSELWIIVATGCFAPLMLVAAVLGFRRPLQCHGFALGLAALAGVVSTIPAAILTPLFFVLFGPSPFWIGVVEETSKLVLAYIVLRKALLTARSMAFVGAMVGLGFAFAENLLYAYQFLSTSSGATTQTASVQQMVLARTLTATMHMLWSTITVMLVSQSLTAFRGRNIATANGLLLTALLHGLWDLPILEPTGASDFSGPFAGPSEEWRPFLASFVGTCGVLGFAVWRAVEVEHGQLEPLERRRRHLAFAGLGALMSSACIGLGWAFFQVHDSGASVPSRRQVTVKPNESSKPDPGGLLKQWVDKKLGINASPASEKDSERERLEVAKDGNSLSPPPQPSEPAPSPSEGKVRIDDLRMSSFPTPNGGTLYYGRIRIVNEGDKAVDDFRLYLVVGMRRYVMLPYEGSLIDPQRLWRRTIPARTSLEVPVLTESISQFASFGSKRVILGVRFIDGTGDDVADEVSVR